MKNDSDNKILGSLTKENKELTEQLEERLENIRKLISRNEQLTNQQRILKQRHEKVRKEEEAKHQAQMEEKNSEI